MAFCDSLSPHGRAHSGSALVSVPTAFPGIALHQQTNSWQWVPWLPRGLRTLRGIGCCVRFSLCRLRFSFSLPHNTTSGLPLSVSEPLYLPCINGINWMGLSDGMRSDRECIQRLIVFSWGFDPLSCHISLAAAREARRWRSLHSKRLLLDSLPGDLSLGSPGGEEEGDGPAGSLAHLPFPKASGQESRGSVGFNTYDVFLNSFAGKWC